MISLPHILLEELRKKAKEKGISVEEFLLDPENKVRKYVDVALELLEQAREELKKNDLRQASEKIWGSCALAIKAYAFWREKRLLESHSELWKYKSKVAKELGEWVRDAWMYANSMHRNFYEGEADKEDVEKSLRLVERLVKTITKRVKG
ncbi:MAG: hypothetical protein DRJ62_06605 [Thermoprotei archaeon]|nr:MAG: hypothetical protein DRJ62_06605 [Thermoprotei archaeon]